MTTRILPGDCIEVLRTLPAESVQMCVTSPPYWGLRDYNCVGQIGLEDTPWQWLDKMVEVFREVKRVLRNDGTLWMNMGDSYAGSWGNYGGQNRGAGQQRKILKGSSIPNPAYDGREKERPSTSHKIDGVKPKDMMGMPWRLAFALQDDGWWLRSDIIWHKPNPMPSSVTDRPTPAHEYLFLLSKSARYYYDQEAIKEQCTETEISRPAGWATGPDHSAVGWATEKAQGRKSWKGSSFDTGKTGEMKETRGGTKKSGNLKRKTGIERGCPESNSSNVAGSVPWEGTMRNKRDVWTIATQPFPAAHFATYPPKLIEPCILAGAPKGGIVLDPFFGAGTTGLVCDRLQRDCIGIEINPDYIEIAKNRILKDGGMFASVNPEQKSQAPKIMTQEVFL